MGYYCDHSVDWKRKSTIDDHLNSKTHKTKKNFYENKQRQLQQTLVSSISSSESKRTIIHDLIEAFAITDIPLENVDSLINLISFRSVEQSFSKYNSILGDNQQNLSEESLRSLR